MIFMEIENIILYLSISEVPNLPWLGYINEETAKWYNWQPFYIYMRPFAISLLNKLFQKYNLSIYSWFQRDLILLLLHHIEKESELFEIWVSSNGENWNKYLPNFFNDQWNKKNTIMLDYRPEVFAINSGSWVPVIKCKGNTKDATLLYLEKYLLSIAGQDDLSAWIQRDFNLT